MNAAVVLYVLVAAVLAAGAMYASVSVRHWVPLRWGLLIAILWPVAMIVSLTRPWWDRDGSDE